MSTAQFYDGLADTYHALYPDWVGEVRAQAASLHRPGGTVIVSIRDYDRILADPPASTLPQVFASGGARVISFQLWDWRGEKDIYDLEHFQVHEQADGTRPMDDERRADITTVSSCVEVADGEPSQIVIARRDSDRRDPVTALIAAAVASVRARQPETIGS